MRTNKYILVIVGLLLIMASNQIEAQSSTARKETRKGNKEYKAKKYDQSEVNYRRAIHDDSNAYRAQYNLGNALYKQKKYDEANSHYSKALETPDLSNKNKAKILHNRGNSSLKAGLAKENRAEGMQQFQQAVNDYQEALKLTPKDENTRYNLSYAKKMLQQAQQQQQQQQQNGGGGGGQDQKDQNKDKNKDQQNDQGNQGNDQQKDQNKQNQNKQDQNKQDQQQSNKQKQDRQQQQREQQKKQDAERLLEAVKNNEKNTMKDNAKKVEVATPVKIEKDW